MKALSLMQPWAWMMTHGLPGIPMKDIENRKWATSFRGPVLVHASKTFDFEGLSFIEDKLEDLGFEPGEVLPENYQMGGIVGMFTITDCVKTSDSPWFFGPYGFLVKAARPLPFVPLRGQLNFFTVQEDILESMFEWKEVDGIGTYVCDICGSQNGRVGGMKAHIRNVHGEVQS